MILRDSAVIGASKTKLVTGKYFEGAYATIPDPATAHDEAGANAHHVSAKWNLNPAPGYVSAAGNDNTVDANNPVRTYSVYDCMHTDLFNTSALIPAHNDTKIRIRKTPRNPISIWQSAAGDVAGIDDTFAIRIIAVRCQTIRCTDPNALAKVDAIIGDEYILPTVSIVGFERTFIAQENNVNVAVDLGVRGLLTQTMATVQGKTSAP
jgi:hypothetical protein